MLVSVGMDKRICFWDISKPSYNMKPVFEIPCGDIPLVAAQGFGDFCYSDRKNCLWITKWDLIKST